MLRLCALLALVALSAGLDAMLDPVALSETGWEAVDVDGELARGEPPAPVLPEGEEHATIFVGIAAFREWRCGLTVFSALTQARHPGESRSLALRARCADWRETRLASLHTVLLLGNRTHHVWRERRVEHNA